MAATAVSAIAVWVPSVCRAISRAACILSGSCVSSSCGVPMLFMRMHGFVTCTNVVHAHAWLCNLYGWAHGSNCLLNVVGLAFHRKM